MKKFFLIFSSLTLLAGCTDPMDTKITRENYYSVMEKIRKTTSEKEWQQVQTIQMVARASKEGEVKFLEGNSFREIVDKLNESGLNDFKITYSLSETTQPENNSLEGPIETSNKEAYSQSSKTTDSYLNNNINTRIKTLLSDSKKISSDPMNIKITKENYYSLVKKVKKQASGEDLQIINLVEEMVNNGKNPKDFEGYSFRGVINVVNEGMKAEQEKHKSSFGNGIHIVGKDIQPGTYKTENAQPLCSYQRLKGFSGEINDIIAVNNTKDIAIVTIKDSDKGFKSARCARWIKL